MNQLQEEFGDDGLVVMALSNEKPDLVSDYLDSMNISVRVAAEAVMDGAFKPPHYPYTLLIDADGEIIWTGSPRELSNGKVKEALKGAKKTSGSYLSYNATGEHSEKGIKKITDLALNGKLAKAHKAAIAMAAKSDSVLEQSQAKSLQAELEEYVLLLGTQAESFIERRQMVVGTDVLATIGKEFKGSEMGEKAMARLTEIEKDETLANEWEADKALTKLKEKAAKQGWRKNVKKLEGITKKYQGTAAAKKARKLIRTANAR